MFYLLCTTLYLQLLNIPICLPRARARANNKMHLTPSSYIMHEWCVCMCVSTTKFSNAYSTYIYNIKLEINGCAKMRNLRSYTACVLLIHVRCNMSIFEHICSKVRHALVYSTKTKRLVQDELYTRERTVV